MIMTERENLLRLLRRQGYGWVPADLSMCPSLAERYERETGRAYVNQTMEGIPDAECECTGDFAPYYRDRALKSGASVDSWGVASEPGIFHLVRMVHPLQDAKDVDSYPFPRFTAANESAQVEAVRRIQAGGRAAVGNMQMTIWETAWYLRGMENLMIDMMDDAPIARRLLDEVTERAAFRAAQFARAGADMLYLGDDVGTQRGLLMSAELYRAHLKPRLRRVIEAARAVKPDICVLYHSCGDVRQLIGDLIDVGVDVLNPVQPECMGFEAVFREYGDRLSFWGGVGTQTTMPFGGPADVKARVFELLELAGPRGGVLPAPTHVLEPEVPVSNVRAYLDALREWNTTGERDTCQARTPYL